MTAVRDIESATSPLANEVKIFEVAPPGLLLVSLRRLLFQEIQAK